MFSLSSLTSTNQDTSVSSFLLSDDNETFDKLNLRTLNVKDVWCGEFEERYETVLKLLEMTWEKERRCQTLETSLLQFFLLFYEFCRLV